MALLASCADKKSPDTTAQQPPSAGFTIDSEVAQREGVSTGRASMQPFASVVKANGVLKVLPQGQASVASPIGANVKRILVAEGQYVTRGQTLALVGHPDLLDLQARYLTANSKMAFVSLEYQRQKQLYGSRVGSGRDFQQTSSEYHQLQSELKVIGQQLTLLGISLNALRKGHTVSSIAIKSPIAGTVESVTTTVGQYASPETSLFTIVNADHTFADVMVYENDLRKIGVGNAVQMESKSWAGMVSGKVTSVGTLFDENNRAVHVRIAFTGKHGRPVPGAYVSASIHSAGTKRLAVPDEAVATDAERTYVFLVKRNGRRLLFIPRQVRIGQVSGGYSEILSGVGSSDTIALSGAYMLMSEWRKADSEQ
jgi:cobalt-zinc-cadmium efflux system membrane fusion protein